MDVTIRPLIEQDAYTSVNWRNDREVFRFTGNTYDQEITIQSELDWINRVMVTPNDCRCAIEADGEYVGNIYLTDIGPESATYHIFIGAKEYWGKGVAKKASVLILRHAFNQLGLKKVNLRVRTENTRAVNLYRGLGFKETDREDPFIKMELTKDSFKF